MTCFMPPIQRKKKVEDKYCPDSFRVISEDATSDHPKYKPLPYRASFEPRTPTPKILENIENKDQPTHLPLRPLKSTRVLPHMLPDYRGNKPQTLSCGFLDKNVRFLNEPICNVYTKPVQHEEKRWWPSRPNPGELLIPPYAEDTNYRDNFSCKHGERHTGSGRHSANVDRDPARGVIPVNYLRGRNDEKRFYKEGISYEHMYNSRSDPNYPIRGKRHGGFVWNKMDPISQNKFIEYYQKLDEEDRKFEEMKMLASAKKEIRSQENGVSSPQKTSPTAFTTAKLVSQSKEETIAKGGSENVNSQVEMNQDNVSGKKEKCIIADEKETDKDHCPEGSKE